MKTKKRGFLSLLLILVMVCTYVAGHNSFASYAVEESTEQVGEATEEVVLFEGSNSSMNWGQAVTLYSGSGFSKNDLLPDAQIAVTYEGTKEPILSLQSWTNQEIWQNVSASYSSNGIAYLFSDRQ